MATCGDCTYFTSCFNSHEQPNNEDHEICGRYLRHEHELNEFCARIGLSGDVPHDASTECAVDTD